MRLSQCFAIRSLHVKSETIGDVVFMFCHCRCHCEGLDCLTDPVDVTVGHTEPHLLSCGVCLPFGLPELTLDFWDKGKVYGKCVRVLK